MTDSFVGPAVAVVVPAYDEADTIGACLTALDAQTYEGDVTVVVVDNGSTDATAERAAAHEVTVIHEPTQGSYAARNAGIEWADADVFAFTDADARPAPDWLARGIDRLGADADVVSGPITPARVDDAGLGRRYDRVLGFDTETCKTANLLARRSVFDDVGLFDERLTSGGDGEWAERAESAGWTVVYDPDVVVNHDARDGLRELVGKHIRTGYGAGQAARLRTDRVTPVVVARYGLERVTEFPVWVGWTLKRIVGRYGEELDVPAALAFVALAFPLGLATVYGQFRGFLDGGGGRRVGDYGWW